MKFKMVDLFAGAGATKPAPPPSPPRLDRKDVSRLSGDVGAEFMRPEDNPQHLYQAYIDVCHELAEARSELAVYRREEEDRLKAGK